MTSDFPCLAHQWKPNEHKEQTLPTRPSHPQCLSPDANHAPTIHQDAQSTQQVLKQKGGLPPQAN
eukprot:3765059-Amphidinium_carterae.1